jgi:hypothetical protein
LSGGEDPGIAAADGGVSGAEEGVTASAETSSDVAGALPAGPAENEQEGGNEDAEDFTAAFGEESDEERDLLSGPQSTVDASEGVSDD